MVLKELINSEISISVGEPWDFKSDAGENILKGFINLVSDDNGIEWLRCETSAFDYEKYKIASVIAVSRYADQSFKSLLKGEKITSNFLYDPTGRELDSNQISEVLKNKVGMNFLVGSIQLIFKKSRGSSLEK